MNNIYGPVKSRRLGASLGVNVTPYKYCSFDCIYCQLKHTTKFTLERKEYIKAESIISEVAQFFKAHPEQKIDYITISGSGEPLLNSKVEIIIDGIKKLTNAPLALITNSALLYDKDIRHDILKADLILPSLDAVTQDVFDKIDRPVASPRINIENIINGLIELRREFKGKIWLEIMLVKGINDGVEYASKFKEVINRINPDKIQLNIPSRIPCEAWVKIPTLRRIKKIQSILGRNCELI